MTKKGWLGILSVFLMVLSFRILAASTALAAPDIAAEQRWVQGIYLTQATAESKERVEELIEDAQHVGINTFVIDLERKVTKHYRDNIALINKSGIAYVARIVMFPADGGTRGQVLSPRYWEKKYQLAEEAINLGAKEIQLDYLRYTTKQPRSAQNARDIYQIIKWFNERLDEQNIPLQIDVFGVATFGESAYIGQNLKLFADSVDAMCPMVYPSHYEPYLKYAKIPYEIISYSLNSLRAQFDGKIPFKVYPYIETYNYRYRMSQPEKVKYIKAQLAAVEDSDVDGWLVWNPHNDYDNLFIALQELQQEEKEDG